MPDKQNSFLNYLKAHKGVAIGIGIGLLVGILILAIGFFSTLFLAICAGIGAFFGTNTPLKKRLVTILDRILPDIFRQN